MTLHERRLLGASENPSPLPARRRVDARPHVVQDLRHVLDLVEDGRWPYLRHEAARVGADARVAEQGRLSGSARAGQDERWKVAGRAQDLLLEEAWDVGHIE